MEKTMNDDCIFCKIIQGEIPSYTVFENEDVKAFLDISQVTPGHTLMIPKKHIANMFEFSKEDAAKYLKYIPEIARAVKGFDPEIKGMNIANNNGAVAYQSVFHAHIHFVPRYSDHDGFKMVWTDNSAQYDNEQYQAIADKIKQQFEVE